MRKPRGGTYRFSHAKLRKLVRESGLSLHSLQTDFFGRGHRTSLNDYLEGKRTPSLEVFMDLAELLYVDPGEVSNNFFDRRTKK